MMKVLIVFSLFVVGCLSNSLTVRGIYDVSGEDFFPGNLPTEVDYFGPKGCDVRQESDGSTRLHLLYSHESITSGGIVSWDVNDLSSPAGVVDLNFEGENIQHVDIVNSGRNFSVSGLTFDKDGNYQVVGMRLLRITQPGPKSKIEPVVVTFGDNEPNDLEHYPQRNSANQILGPIAIREPISYLASGLTYDKEYDVYWVVDPVTSMLWQTQLTCCDEVEHGEEKRWEHQLKVRRGCGLKYGLHSHRDWFYKRDGLVDDTKFANPPLPESEKSLVASPGLSSVTGVTVDPNGDLWVLNNFPTTTLYHINRKCEVEVAYNLEAATSGLQDAECIAVTEDSIYVGFEMEERLVEFERPPCPGDE